MLVTVRLQVLHHHLRWLHLFLMVHDRLVLLVTCIGTWYYLRKLLALMMLRVLWMHYLLRMAVDLLNSQLGVRD